MNTSRSFPLVGKHRDAATGLPRGSSISILAITLCLALMACDIETTSSMHWDNGQLSVLSGSQNSQGGREGVWVYFDREGRVERTQEVAGARIDGTGFYRDGHRVRDLTEQELATALPEAERLTREYRQRHH